jgi:hypothetical protein
MRGRRRPPRRRATPIVPTPTALKDAISPASRSMLGRILNRSRTSTTTKAAHRGQAQADDQRHGSAPERDPNVLRRGPRSPQWSGTRSGLTAIAPTMRNRVVDDHPYPAMIPATATPEIAADDSRLHGGRRPGCPPTSRPIPGQPPPRRAGSSFSARHRCRLEECRPFERLHHVLRRRPAPPRRGREPSRRRMLEARPHGPRRPRSPADGIASSRFPMRVRLRVQVEHQPLARTQAREGVRQVLIVITRAPSTQRLPSRDRGRPRPETSTIDLLDGSSSEGVRPWARVVIGDRLTVVPPDVQPSPPARSSPAGS